MEYNGGFQKTSASNHLSSHYRWWYPNNHSIKLWHTFYWIKIKTIQLDISNWNWTVNGTKQWSWAKPHQLFESKEVVISRKYSLQRRFLLKRFRSAQERWCHFSCFRRLNMFSHFLTMSSSQTHTNRSIFWYIFISLSLFMFLLWSLHIDILHLNHFHYYSDPLPHFRRILLIPWSSAN